MPTAVAPRLYVDDAPKQVLLAVYVRDHLTGSMFGLRLARRALGHAHGRSYEGELREVVRQIHEDRDTLLRTAAHLGIPRPRLREGLTEAGDIAGRVKLNGQLVGTSPLSRLVELEGLLLGVRGKLQLWKSLDAALEVDQLPDDVHPRTMSARADEQLERLTEAHATAAREAFGAAG